MIALWLVVTYYFDESRKMLIDFTRPAWVRIVQWRAREEMKQVGRDVVDQEVKTGSLPDPRTWAGWLDYRYSQDDLKQDQWGSTYQFRMWADSIAIWSYGPDRLANTGDDFQVATPRQRHGR
jgi:hypothetical protein